MQGGVKILYTISDQKDNIVINLKDIYSVKDNIHDLAFDKIFNNSLKTKGMLNPILVCKQSEYVEKFKSFERRPVPDNVPETYRCLIGNNRYDYALRNGYTHIECLVVDTLEQLKQVHKQTFIEPRRM